MYSLTEHQFVNYKSISIYFLLNIIIVTALAVCIISASKIITIGSIVIPCSNIFLALLTFPITDIISEIWGKAYAKRAVLIALTSQTLFVILIQISLQLPVAEQSIHNTAYETLLSGSPRFLIAGLVAFFFSQLWDVIIYAKLKALTKGRYLWLRNNLSTMTSQIVNACLFISISFYELDILPQLIISSILLRFCLAAIDTPLVYLGVWLIHRHLDGQSHAFTAEE